MCLLCAHCGAIAAFVLLYWTLQASREGTCIASSLQELQAQVADYMSGHPGQKTIATLQQHVSRKLAAALVSVQGVDPGGRQVIPAADQ